MTKYTVKDPDGVAHDIMGPDNATPDEVIRQAQTVVPYKPRAGMNGMNLTNPQTSQPQAPAQQSQQGPNPFMQLVLSRLGVQMPDPQKQAQAEADLEYTRALTKKANEPQIQRPEYYDDGVSPNATRQVIDRFSGKITDTGVKSGDKRDKSDASIYRDEARQDRLEKEYTDRLTKVVASRTGQLGMQDAKVNQAVHLRT